MCCSLVSVAQEWDYSYTQYTKNDGLPSNTIYCVTSDKNGILWLGTDAGVVRFDGYNVKVFNTDDGLPSNDVFEVVCDSKNRIWVTTFKSDIVYFQNDKLHTKKNDTLLQKINADDTHPRYFEDTEHNLWIRRNNFKLLKVTKNDEVYNISFNFKTDDSYNISELNKKLYFISYFHTIEIDIFSNNYKKIENIDAVKVDGLSIFKDKCYYINTNNTISEINVSELVKGKITAKSLNWNFPIIDSCIWILSKNGFRKYNINNLYSSEYFLKNYPVSFFHQDKIGNKWIATLSNGIYKLNSLSIKNILNNSLYSVYLNNNKIYAGSINGEVFILDRFTLKIIDKFTINVNSLSSYRILKIIEINNSLYIISDKGVFIYSNDKRSIANVDFQVVAVKNIYLSNNEIIILDNQGIKFFDFETYKLKDSVFYRKRFYSYCEYKDKKVVGSQDSLYYIDKVFKPYPLDIHFNFRAVDLLVKDSLLIATTAEKGVFFINDHKVVKNINNSNGLSSNTCYKSVIYKDALYTATNKGINVYNFTTDSLYHLFESDGLPSNTVFDLKVFNDTIYAATEAGLSVIPLTAIPHFKSFPLLATPIVAGRDTFYDLPAQLGMYTDQEMTLVLNGLSYGTKTPVRYHYKIINSDTNYKTGLDQHIQINNLNHGNYTFTAYAENSEGIVSNTLNIPFTVKPYFYQTSWFKIFIIIVYFILIYVFTLWMIARTRKKEKRKNELNNKVRNLELAAWKSAINPHFIFNSLNNLQGLFLNNDIDKANRYTQEFSDILRKTIENSGKLFLTIDEEIKYLKNYLSLEVIKRDNRFEYEITTTDEKLLSYYIPSLIIQSIIENSLKHGIKDQLGGFIKVIFAYDEKNITCTIQDNGIGFQESNTKNEVSKGIKLLKHKLSIVERLLKKKFIFEFHNRYNEAQEIIGAETIFIFPILNFENESYLHSNHY
ncbi:MAG: histidine kinase [Bacteroidetes bacterium]|nr:histidine kinase [Bacteroidota bacterium]MBK7040856.1 histidine kinase [Bacteroidota bacterium]MBK9299183.1 histidine kinase [Bacteroidota bacterium]HQW45980.1 histidine kinase [Chitinophagaceae bacterium]